MKKLLSTLLSVVMIVTCISLNNGKVIFAEENAIDYLCFTAEEENATIQLKKSHEPNTIYLQYSIDKNNWIDYTIDDVITLTNIGDCVYFRSGSSSIHANNKNNSFGKQGGYYYYFDIPKKVAASGNIMSLYYTDYRGHESSVDEYAFSHLFYNCVGLTSAPTLPATKLAEDCYYYMFAGCTNLKEAPALPATDLSGAEE